MNDSDKSILSKPADTSAGNSQHGRKRPTADSASDVLHGVQGKYRDAIVTAYREKGGSFSTAFSEANQRAMSEAIFAVENEIEHSQGNIAPGRRTVVNDLRMRKDCFLPLVMGDGDGWTLISDAPDSSAIQPAMQLREEAQIPAAQQSASQYKAWLESQANKPFSQRPCFTPAQWEHLKAVHDAVQAQLTKERDEWKLRYGELCKSDSGRITPWRDRLDAERQRANRLADELGSMRQEWEGRGAYIDALKTELTDIRSFIGSKLRDQYDRLRGKR